VTKLPDGSCELHYELWLQHGNGRSGSKETSAFPCAKAEKPAAAKKPKQ
jgi:hypothetical protein